MAGYIFTVSKKEWSTVRRECIQYGFFAPFTPQLSKVNSSDSKELKALKKTLATLSSFYGDLITMKEGDNVYFLSDRKIYGIGVAKIVGLDCKYDNYFNASAMILNEEYDYENALVSNDSRARWVVFFSPQPYFFNIGVDMDDVLSFRPTSFKMLRAFQDLSFIKIDDDENRALKEYISLVNEKSYDELAKQTMPFDDRKHISLCDKELSKYIMNIEASLLIHNKENIVSESFIESLLLQKMVKNDFLEIGHWDYLTQQLIASPFKPIKYIDRIDVYGYRFSSNYQGQPKLITKYLIIEIKKEKVNKSTLEQLMQYVDWVCKEYAAGDYSLIDAYVLGKGAVRNIVKDGKLLYPEICKRTFILSSHPVVQKEWANIKIINYSINEATNEIDFKLV